MIIGLGCPAGRKPWGSAMRELTRKERTHRPATQRQLHSRARKRGGAGPCWGWYRSQRAMSSTRAREAHPVARHRSRAVLLRRAHRCHTGISRRPSPLRRQILPCSPTSSGFGQYQAPRTVCLWPMLRSAGWRGRQATGAKGKRGKRKGGRMLLRERGLCRTRGNTRGGCCVTGGSASDERRESSMTHPRAMLRN